MIFKIIRGKNELHMKISISNTFVSYTFLNYELNKQYNSITIKIPSFSLRFKVEDFPIGKLEQAIQVS